MDVAAPCCLTPTPPAPCVSHTVGVERFEKVKRFKHFIGSNTAGYTLTGDDNTAREWGHADNKNCGWCYDTTL